uniref:Uncharacterized protein n=1 Tax=Davidia involucrata TaxID=16924 RepID=A0A5B7BPZ2_DAVIN
MENRRSKSHQMVSRSKPDGRCKKHPKHQQSPGVCSICLRERLSQVSSTSSRSTTTTMATSCSSSSSSSSLSSHYSPSDLSPVHQYRYRIASEARGSSMSISFLNVLTKSRSMAFVSGRMRQEEAKDGKKKAGFWSKLLRHRSKRIDEGLAHSRTMRERVTIRVH